MHFCFFFFAWIRLFSRDGGAHTFLAQFLDVPLVDRTVVLGGNITFHVSWGLSCGHAREVSLTKLPLKLRFRAYVNCTNSIDDLLSLRA